MVFSSRPLNWPVSEPLFSREDVDEAMSSLVSELDAAGVTGAISLVGGAAVALQVAREALTGDIDALHPVSPEFAAAVVRVGDARGWPSTWLNNAVKIYVSHYDTEADWEVRFEGEEAVVRVARTRLLLAMKLYAGRGIRDEADIDLLLDACGVTSVGKAAEIFEHFYPDEEMSRKSLEQLRGRFGTPSAGGQKGNPPSGSRLR